MLDFFLNFIWKTSLFAAGAITVIALLLYFYQNKMLYIPDAPNRLPNTNSEGLREPKEANMLSEDVRITASDGVKLHGWFVKAPHPERYPTIIYFHENAGNIGGRIPFMKYFQRYCEVNILLVAYRGYSYSEGKPTEEGIQRDAIAVLDYAFSRTDIDRTKVFVFGRSLGGAVGIYGLANTNHKVAGLILENTFTSISDMVDIVFAKVARLKPLVLRNFWSSITIINNVKAPIFFIMGLRDELIPTMQMLRLYQAAQNVPFKDKYEVLTGSHNDTWVKDVDEYFKQISDFIDKCIKRNA